MNSSPLLKDVRQLDGRKTDEQLEHHQRDILRRIASLAFPHEVWDVLINHNGGPLNGTNSLIYSVAVASQSRHRQNCNCVEASFH